jgi:hypothetical protein
VERVRQFVVEDAGDGFDCAAGNGVYERHLSLPGLLAIAVGDLYRAHAE